MTKPPCFPLRPFPEIIFGPKTFVHFPKFHSGYIFLLIYLHISIIYCTFAPNFRTMAESWHWQEYGRAWRGIGIYHVTLITPNREQIFGSLVIPDNDPTKATIDRTDFGNAVIDELLNIHNYYPETRILQFCLMPDHLHAIIHVTRPMPKGFLTVARGFFQGVKRIDREYHPNTISGNERRWEMPFVRPMSTHGQLQSMIRYVQMNPQRLATRRLKPGFFCVQSDIVIAGRTYNAVGNIALLQYDHYTPVHVRSIWVQDAEQHGHEQPLRDYKNGCILAARKGTVMVSPFISQHEQEVLHILLKENHPVIYIADNGFGEYFKPSDILFDAVAAGRLLILSPWPYAPDKHHVTRPDCVAMNKMAEDICAAL